MAEAEPRSNAARGGWDGTDERCGERSDGDGRAGAPLPRAVGLPARPELEGEVERNPIFDALVGSDEEDVAGLVAYSIYKQNKRAWLDDFVKTTGRAPSEAETRSYIIGESTERRIATYRRLAASTLAGDAPIALGAAGEGANAENGRRGAVGAGDHRRAGGGRTGDPRRLFRRREIVSAPASSGAPRA